LEKGKGLKLQKGGALLKLCKEGRRAAGGPKEVGKGQTRYKKRRGGNKRVRSKRYAGERSKNSLSGKEKK